MMSMPTEKALVAGFVFMAGAAAVTLSIHMSPMHDIPMPGGWNMSPEWSRLCGRTWLRAAADFISMWVMMTSAMMLPALAPILWRQRLARSMPISGAAYIGVWALFGVAVFAIGAPLAALVMRVPVLSRAIPMTSALAIIAAGAMQFSACKARWLACCRNASHGGVRHGLHCIRCCAPLTVALLALGVMDARAMLFITLCICAERLMPNARRMAQSVGVVLVLLGFVTLV
jgi:predicted metal-binding membrane protein